MEPTVTMDLEDLLKLRKQLEELEKEKKYILHCVKQIWGVSEEKLEELYRNTQRQSAGLANWHPGGL